MFGYLTANTGDLTEEQYRRYRGSYCGLCRCLQENYGQAARLTLNYDMTFLILLLGSLYEPEEREGEETCLIHPREPHPWRRDRITEYAADMNMALAYQKCLDDWRDDGNPAALAAAGSLKRGWKKAEERWPRQCRAIREGLEALDRLETGRIEDPDGAAACFGRMMAELFVLEEDRWSDTLRQFGFALGQFIYLVDACVALDKDAALNHFNPFRRYYGRQDNGPRFRSFLKPILSDCLIAFDRLPMVRDVGILQNVLCAGRWARFEQKYSEKGGPESGPGSL